MLWAVLAAAAAVAAPSYYETRELTIGLPSRDLPALRQAVAQEARRRDVSFWVQGAQVGAQKLTRPQTLAALTLLMHDGAGGELDLLVGQPDGRHVPVTATWEGARIALVEGEAVGELLGEGPSGAALRERFGIGDLVDTSAHWDGRSRALVAEALSRLTTDELALVAGLPFHRVREPSRAVREKFAPGSDEQLAALYATDGDGSRIEIYDAALEEDGFFVGTPSEPKPRSLHVLLHELGHALEAEPFRDAVARVAIAKSAFEAFQSDLQGRYDRRNARSKQGATGRELQGLDAELDRDTAELHRRVEVVQTLAASTQHYDMPASRDLGTVLPRGQAPTMYGRASPVEAFAESFALHHGDRAALVRAAPAVAAWFVAGHHVAAIRAARVPHAGPGDVLND